MRPMRSGTRWRVALWLLGAAGCTTFPAPAPPPITNGVQVGVASWYGPGFHGNHTANGEIYDQYELTAAHPSLALGTRVMVTNLENGRAVQVRINDRGPFVGGRAIDLSYAAAHSIGMVGPGTVRVRIEVLGPATLAATARVAATAPSRPSPPAPRDVPSGSYTVEIAALSDPDKARHLRQVLARRFPEAFVAQLAGTRKATAPVVNRNRRQPPIFEPWKSMFSGFSGGSVMTSPAP